MVAGTIERKRCIAGQMSHGYGFRTNVRQIELWHDVVVQIISS